MKLLEDVLKPTQKELFKIISNMYEGKAIGRKGNFTLVKGEVPIMLLAHLDTVHQEPVREICKSPDGNILMSPQGIGGDDRCGVYALINAYEMSPQKPWLLFTCGEEVGGIGATKFCYDYAAGKLPKELDNLKLLIEIDRKGSNDSVYYDCDNKNFESYITSKGFKTAFGTFSDISIIAPELGVAAVNLSSGYYSAHTLHEYINRRELNVVLAKVIEIISDAAQPDFPKYEYIPRIDDNFIDNYDGKYYQQITYRDGKKKKIWIDNQGRERIAPKYTLNEYCDLWDREDALRFNDTQKKLSLELEGIYEELLDFYTEEELDCYIEEFGEEILYEIYNDEYDAYYTTEEGIKITAIAEK